MNVYMYMHAQLSEATRTHPGVQWWVKADGCDLVEGLGESVNLDWSGDVDMNDGKLHQLYKHYRERLNFIGSLGIKERRNTILQDLNAIIKDIEDVSFISTSKVSKMQIM